MLEIKESNGQFLIVNRENNTRDLKAVAYDREMAERILKSNDNATLLAKIKVVLSTAQSSTNREGLYEDNTFDSAAREILSGGIGGNGAI